ncbi:MAG: hypothetical protein ACJ75M_18750 [Actinomycetes bacterium]
MVLPVGQPVHIELTTADVVHSFYVPQALFKRQAVPGITNQFDLTFDKVGLYHGQCTQFCGLAHTNMVFRVRVVTQGEYQRWLATGPGWRPSGSPAGRARKEPIPPWQPPNFPARCTRRPTTSIGVGWSTT